MKVLIAKLAARLQRLSPSRLATIGVCCVLALGILDCYTPEPDEFRFVLHARRRIRRVGRGQVARRGRFRRGRGHDGDGAMGRAPQ